MKLQINDAGSWRQVSNFNAFDEHAVREQSAKLLAIVNERASLRILDDTGAVRAYCKAPDYSWREKV